MNYRGYKNLKIAAPTDYPEMETRMGIQKSEPELKSIIDKVTASIPIKRKKNLKKHLMQSRRKTL